MNISLTIISKPTTINKCRIEILFAVNYEFPYKSLYKNSILFVEFAMKRFVAVQHRVVHALVGCMKLSCICHWCDVINVRGRLCTAGHLLYHQRYHHHVIIMIVVIRDEENYVMWNQLENDEQVQWSLTRYCPL